MPTLDLRQIKDKLNDEFAEDTRKIVFWYDEAAEFVDDIDKLELVGAKLHKLEPDGMFRAKYLLEHSDTGSSYLIYAPFPKPDPQDNVLEDTLLYSRRFYADRASLLVADLRINEKYKPVIQKYLKFFEAKDRTQRFYSFEIENYTEETIEIALMSALCKNETASGDEVLRKVLTEGRFDDNYYLEKFGKYGLLPAFWRLCEDSFGYSAAASPSLTQLAINLFITYTARQLHGDVPAVWKEFVSYKSGSIIAFMDTLMNSVVYKPQYDKLAAHIASILNVGEALSGATAEVVIDCDAFSLFDQIILKWISERLLDEDTGAAINGLGIIAVSDLRKRKHFGPQFAGHYEMLEAAHGIIGAAHYNCPDDFAALIEQYTNADHKIDTCYRRFYTALDRLEEAPDYENLRKLVENIYTNEYLGKLLPTWSTSLDLKTIGHGETSQLRFYDNYIRLAKEKTVVIISDAFRYEVAQELFAKLKDDPNCKTDAKYLIAALPTYTQLGMAALLPHTDLEIVEGGKVLVDGLTSDSTTKREAILQATLPNSRCIFNYNLPRDRNELREIFTGMDAVYIYHNHIDDRGSSSENEAFNACSESVNEIYDIIKRISSNGNAQRFIVTADHGFLYKREKFSESERVDSSLFSVYNSPEDEKTGVIKNRRFIISPPLATDNQQLITIKSGVASAPLAEVIGGKETRIISWPLGANVFKTQGGLNYVHGGASPQEMILPLITIKTKRGHVDTHPVKIALKSMVSKITNLFIKLEFFQQEPVCDIAKPAEFKLYFLSEQNEKISNEHQYLADKQDSDPNKRIFSLQFDFKNKKYDPAKKYWLVAVNTESGVELFRHQVIMDIAFADDFGFAN